jgi:hypothetical protein
VLRPPICCVAVGALIVGLTVIGPATDVAWASPSVGQTNLVGTFSISSGHCAASGAPSGSYMEVEVDGTPVPNAASSCSEAAGEYTPLSEGSQGLVTGRYQADPLPTFDALGNSKASGIISPVRFLANTFGLSTTCANQTSDPTPTGDCGSGVSGFSAPSLEAVAPGQQGCAATAGTECLFGDLDGLGATWAGFPVKPILSNPLTGVGTLLAGLTANCADSSGCSSVGVMATPSAGATCVTQTDPGGCALFGTFSPATGAYTLGISTGLALGLLPHAVLQLVLRGTFTPSASGALLGGAGESSALSPGGSTSGATSPGVTAPGGNASSPTAASGVPPIVDGELEGTFTLAASSCPNSTPTGSYFIISYAPVTEGNSSSTCDGGSYTLLQPGTAGLGIGTFTPDPSPTFDDNGNSLANAIITPALFNGHALGLSTSPDDVQDAPQGPPVFEPPEALVDGTNLAVDLRSLNASYDGTPNDTCAQSYGVGCWLEGSRVATGTYDPTTGNFTLGWYSSQDFSGGSGEVDFHLSGHFTGTVGPANPALAEQLAGSTYAVTSTGVESESFDTPTAPKSPPTTSTSPSPSVPRRVDSSTSRSHADVSRSRAALAARPGQHPSSNPFPILVVVVGFIAAAVLLWTGRRSRKIADEVSQEHT